MATARSAPKVYSDCIGSGSHHATGSAPPSSKGSQQALAGRRSSKTSIPRKRGKAVQGKGVAKRSPGAECQDFSGYRRAGPAGQASVFGKQPSDWPERDAPTPKVP